MIGNEFHGLFGDAHFSQAFLETLAVVLDLTSGDQCKLRQQVRFPGILVDPFEMALQLLLFHGRVDEIIDHARDHLFAAQAVIEGTVHHPFHVRVVMLGMHGRGGSDQQE